MARGQIATIKLVGWAAALFVSVAACLLLLQILSVRTGLFNNGTDLDAAKKEHLKAWLSQGRGSRVSRLDMLMITRHFEGECLTSATNWVSVHLDLQIDPALYRNGQVFECRFVTPARFPEGLVSVYVWTLFMKPLGPNDLSVERVERQIMH